MGVWVIEQRAIILSAILYAPLLWRWYQELSVDYASLRVKITLATYLTFGPDSDQPTCHPMPSSLLAHQGSGCNQTFCAVPTTFRYLSNNVISAAPALWQFDFNCVCNQAVCNESLLWLRPTSVQSQPELVSLCEVHVQTLWLLCEVICSVHMLIIVSCYDSFL